MKPLAALAGGFWLIAETVIVLSLLWLDARLRRGPWQRTWILYAALFLAGAVLILAGPGLLAPLGPNPFGPRFAWDLLCTIWLLLEWAMLVHITQVTRAAGARFLGEELFAIGSGAHGVVSALILAGAIVFHAAIVRRAADPETLKLHAYLFVRLAGCGYVLLEAAIAVALARGFVVLRRLVRLA